MKEGTKKRKKMNRKRYEQELELLQVELCMLQRWIREKGLRIIVIFEGRDAAGKGGVIKRITERVSPRVFRVVALPKPNDRERTQLYIQRYMQHFPAAGEVVLFDRSWYNRAGVEPVMGFCTDEEYERFMEVIPTLEREIVGSGVRIIKYFFDVSQAEQERRFKRRRDQPLRQWKLSSLDLESYRRWWDYTKAYDAMFRQTDTEYAPWYIVKADDKRRARLNCMAHLLSQVPYEALPFDRPDLPKREPRGDDVPEQPAYSNVVPERF